jgi:hypothetical protein
MQRASLLLSVFAVAVGVAPIRAQDSVPAPMPPRPVEGVGDDFAGQEPIIIKARFCESDSPEDREKGELRVVSRPTVLTVPNHNFSLHIGGEKVVVDHATGDVDLIEIGRRLEGKVGAVRGGTVRISLTISDTTVEEAGDDGVVLNTQSTRVLKTVALGETTQLSLTPREAHGKVVWVELTFEQVN